MTAGADRRAAVPWSTASAQRGGDRRDVDALDTLVGLVDRRARADVARRRSVSIALDVVRAGGGPGNPTSARGPPIVGMNTKPQTSEHGAQADQSALHAARALAADAAARTVASSPLARPPAGGPDARALRALRPVAELEAEAIAFAHRAGELPYARSTRQRFFEEVRARLHAAGGTDAQLAVVDVVAALFDYEITDRALPEPARPLVWRLQQPVLLLALIDPGYLGDRERSVRALIENLGAIADDFGGQWQRGGELHERIETVVRALEIVAANLYERLRVLAVQVEREQSRAGDGVRRLVQRMIRQRQALEATPEQRNRRDYARRPGREQEKAVTEQISTRIARKTHDRLLPATVVTFLDEVWARVLRTTALRDGEDSPAFDDALSVVDELLDTVDGEDHAGVRARLAARIPMLIERLHSGMRQIGVAPDAHRDFFDELFLLHLRRLHRADGGGAPVLRRRPAPSSTQAELRGATYYDVDALPDPDAPAGGRHRRVVPPAPRVEDVPSLPTIAAESQHSDATSDRARVATAEYDHPASYDTSEVPVLETEIEPVDESDARAVTETRPVVSDSNRHVQSFPSTHSDAVRADERTDRLLALIETVALDDLPMRAVPSNARASQQFGQLSAGHWLEYRPRRDRRMRLKVVWINAQRSVAILVRAPDRRAVSRPMPELADLFRRGKLRRLESALPEPARLPDLSPR
ncbi:MAG: DUF1631 family protein [Burkholderiaceae bacterium]